MLSNEQKTRAIARIREHNAFCMGKAVNPATKERLANNLTANEARFALT